MNLLQRNTAPMKSIFTLSLLLMGSLLYAQSYTSYFTGDEADVDPQTNYGIVLMGGAGEDDNAMTWFLERSGGGDIVVIRTSGSDGYNNYMYSGLGVTVNSVETIVFNDASASEDPYVLQQLSNAEAIWMAGGNQATYVDYWKDSPVQEILEAHIIASKPIGGISAGMAVLGGIYFSAMNGTVTSEEALANPHNNNMTLGYNDFLTSEFLVDVVTDTHYDDPDRKGRHMAFIARSMSETVDYRNPYGIACDEYAAVCIDETGRAWCYGEAPEFEDYVYFLRRDCDGEKYPNLCEPNQALEWDWNGHGLKVLRINATPAGDQFLDLNDWLIHEGGTWFNWTVSNGVLNEVEGEAPNCPGWTNVEEQEQVNFDMYPNPANETIVVESDPGDVISLFDLNGRMLMQTTATSSSTKLDLIELASGLYLVQVGTRSGKFVKE